MPIVQYAFHGVLAVHGSVDNIVHTARSAPYCIPHLLLVFGANRLVLTDVSQCKNNALLNKGLKHEMLDLPKPDLLQEGKPSVMQMRPKWCHFFIYAWFLFYVKSISLGFFFLQKCVF